MQQGLLRGGRLRGLKASARLGSLSVPPPSLSCPGSGTPACPSAPWARLGQGPHHMWRLCRLTVSLLSPWGPLCGPGVPPYPSALGPGVQGGIWGTRGGKGLLGRSGIKRDPEGQVRGWAQGYSPRELPARAAPSSCHEGPPAGGEASQLPEMPH